MFRCIWLTMLMAMNWSRGNQETYLTITLDTGACLGRLLLVRECSLTALTDSEPGYFLRAGTCQTQTKLSASHFSIEILLSPSASARVTQLTHFHTQRIILQLRKCDVGAPSASSPFLLLGEIAWNKYSRNIDFLPNSSSINSNEIGSPKLELETKSS